jgi:hypothetical protein
LQNITNGFSNHCHPVFHPDGTIYIALNQNNPSNNGKPRNVIILKGKPGPGQTYETCAYTPIKSYVEGVDSADAFSASGLVLLPSGDILAFLTRGIQAADKIRFVLSVDTIHGQSNAFTGSIIVSNPTPPPANGSTLDAAAREAAATALARANAAFELANRANTLASAVTPLSTRLKQLEERLITQEAREIPTRKAIEEIAWAKAVDAIGGALLPGGLISQAVKRISQETLLAAINYAQSHPATSALAKLIRSIKAAA